MARKKVEISNEALGKYIMSFIESQDDEVYSGKDILDRLIKEGYKADQVRTVVEDLIARYKITVYRSGRIGKESL